MRTSGGAVPLVPLAGLQHIALPRPFRLVQLDQLGVWRSKAGDSERTRGRAWTLWRGEGQDVAHSRERP
jgi:hypothetical protein